MTTKTDKEIEQIAENLIRNEVLSCQSSLVDMLLHRGDVDGFTIDEINFNAPDPERWAMETCREWIDDNHGETAGPQAADYVIVGDDGETVTDIDEDEYTEAMQEFIRDNWEPSEIFEWWSVTSWLAEKLADQGEPILDNDYGTWWGRTCCGQGMISDGTFQRIAESLNR